MHQDENGRQGLQGEPHPWAALWRQVEQWASEEGFSQIAVADIHLGALEQGLLDWLAAGFAGSMHYFERHGLKRMRPAELVPGTVRVLTARLDYLPAEGPQDWMGVEARRLADPGQATVSLYARGRDYHRVLRQRLARLAARIAHATQSQGYRAFTDSAPVAEVALAQKAGLGWRGKNTLLLNREGGSMFFLGEIFVDIPFEPTPPVAPHCGQCTACLHACPTGAIVAPYQLDARRCLSYLTIESSAPIPQALRPLIGNRIYGCDDCQTACPWNKYARRSELADFAVRSDWLDPTLLQLWAWTEADFLRRTEGSPIRRIGWERWRRNLAVALGNGLRAVGAQSPAQESAVQWCVDVRAALEGARSAASAMVKEHIAWALACS